MINKLNMEEEIALITFENAPTQIGFITSLFGMAADRKINIDMISQTAQRGGGTTISFTAHDADVAQLLEIAKIQSEKHNAIKTFVSASNVKIALYSKEMALNYGVAAKVFKVLNDVNVDIILITTSEEDISILVPSSSADAAYNAFAKEFGL